MSNHGVAQRADGGEDQLLSDNFNFKCVFNGGIFSALYQRKIAIWTRLGAPAILSDLFWQQLFNLLILLFAIDFNR